METSRSVVVGASVNSSSTQTGSPIARAAEGWLGLPMNLEWLPEDASASGIHFTQPMLAIARSGCGQRWFRHGGHTQALFSAPGMIELYAAGFCIDDARWKGTAGEVVTLGLPSATINRLLQDDQPPFMLQTRHELFDLQLCPLVFEMWDEAAAGSPNGLLYAQGLSLAVLGLLTARHGACRAGPERTAGLGREQRSRVLAFIDSQLSSNVSIEQLAAVTKMSPRRFAGAFRATFQVSPHAYVLERRIEAASRMLREETGLSLAEVAARTGFSSQAHFTETFRRKVKTTPARWRSGR